MCVGGQSSHASDEFRGFRTFFFASCIQWFCLLNVHQEVVVFNSVTQQTADLMKSFSVRELISEVLCVCEWAECHWVVLLWDEVSGIWGVYILVPLSASFHFMFPIAAGSLKCCGRPAIKQYSPRRIDHHDWDCCRRWSSRLLPVLSSGRYRPYYEALFTPSPRIPHNTASSAVICGHL